MNKIYFDLYSKTIEKEDIKAKNKISLFFKKLKYSIKNLCKNYRIIEKDENIAFKIDIDYLNSICLRENRKYSIEERRILKLIKNKFKSNDLVKIVFCKKLFEMHNNKKYIVNFLQSIKEFNFEIVKAKNEMLEHDSEHIRRYITRNKISKEKVRILIFISSISDFNEKKIIEYINKYKVLDFIVTEKLSKREIKMITNKIDDINNEYGSTIELLKNKNDLKRYNVYIIFAKIDKEKLMSTYIMNKKSLYIDISNIDSDFLNSGYKLFVKNEVKIKQELSNLELNINNFSISLLGKSIV